MGGGGRDFKGHKMAEEAAWACWCLHLQPVPPQWVSGTGPAAAPRGLSVSPEARGQEGGSWALGVGGMGSVREAATAFDGGGGDRFFPPLW